MTAIPVIAGIMMLSFLLVQSMPGDPLRMLVPPDLLQGPEGEAFLEAQRERFGLNDPVIIQFFHWVGELFQGNLGFSFHLGAPVTEILGDRGGTHPHSHGRFNDRRLDLCSASRTDGRAPSKQCIRLHGIRRWDGR